MKDQIIQLLKDSEEPLARARNGLGKSVNEIYEELAAKIQKLYNGLGKLSKEEYESFCSQIKLISHSLTDPRFVRYGYFCPKCHQQLSWSEEKTYYCFNCDCYKND